MQRLYDGVKCFEWIIFFDVSLYRNHYFIRVRINIHMTKTGKGESFNWYFMFSSFIIFISKIWIGCWNQQSSSFIHLSMIPMVAKLICHFKGDEFGKYSYECKRTFLHFNSKYFVNIWQVCWIKSIFENHILIACFEIWSIFNNLRCVLDIF